MDEATPICDLFRSWSFFRGSSKSLVQFVVNMDFHTENVCEVNGLFKTRNHQCIVFPKFALTIEFKSVRTQDLVCWGVFIYTLPTGKVSPQKSHANEKTKPCLTLFFYQSNTNRMLMTKRGYYSNTTDVYVMTLIPRKTDKSHHSRSRCVTRCAFECFVCAKTQSSVEFL